MTTLDSGALGQRLPSVDTTKPKRVYGKRNGAPAVLDREPRYSKLPAAGCESATIDSSCSGRLVDVVQEKLSAVTINDGGHVNSCLEKDSQEYISYTGSAEERAQRKGKKDCDPEAPKATDVTRQRQTALAVVVPKMQGSRRKTAKSTRKNHRPPPDGRYVENRAVHSYARPILEQAISPVASTGVQQFEHWARAAGDRFRVEKIAEGSYGEVYQLHLSSDGVLSKREISQSMFSKLKAYDAGIFKIVPLRAPRGPGSKKFTSVDEVVSEVQLLRLLDPVPGFVRFRDVHVVQGRFPDTYQEAWVKYSQCNDDCFNPDPGSKKSYPDAQLWAILEMDNAGYELEKFACSSVSQMYDIFWGVALGLARAEQLSAFEHRDLHLGNICIKPRDANDRSACSAVEDESHIQTGFGLSGTETTIIDYSLSRAEFAAAADDDAAANSSIAWSDLDKKKIFDAVGRDDEEKLLRDTYRRMRSHVNDQNSIEGKHALKRPRWWKSYNPGTNLIWLSFVLAILLKRYKSSREVPPRRQPLGERDPNRQLIGPTTDKPHPSKPEQSSSPTHTPDTSLFPDDDFVDLEDELLERLEGVLGFLDVENCESELACAGDLVATAIGLDWLSESDFLC